MGANTRGQLEIRFVLAANRWAGGFPPTDSRFQILVVSKSEQPYSLSRRGQKPSGLTRFALPKERSKRALVEVKPWQRVAKCILI